MNLLPKNLYIKNQIQIWSGDQIPAVQLSMPLPERVLGRPSENFGQNLLQFYFYTYSKPCQYGMIFHFPDLLISSAAWCFQILLEKFEYQEIICFKNILLMQTCTMICSITSRHNKCMLIFKNEAIHKKFLITLISSISWLISLAD